MSLTKGTNSVFKLADSSDTLQTLVGDGFELGFSLDTTSEDDTRFGDTFSAEDTILKSVSGSLSVLWSDTWATRLLGVWGDQKAYEYNPVGTATGKMKLTGKFRVGGVELPAAVGSRMMLSATLGPAGAMTIGSN